MPDRDVVVAQPVKEELASEEPVDGGRGLVLGGPTPGHGLNEAAAAQPAALAADAELEEAGGAQGLALDVVLGPGERALGLDPAAMGAAEAGVGAHGLAEVAVERAESRDLVPEPVEEAEHRALVLRQPGRQQRQEVQRGGGKAARGMEDRRERLGVGKGLEPARRERPARDGEIGLDLGRIRGDRTSVPRDPPEELVHLPAVLDEAQDREAPLDFAPGRAAGLPETGGVVGQRLVQEQGEARPRFPGAGRPLGDLLHGVQLGAAARDHEGLEVAAELVPQDRQPPLTVLACPGLDGGERLAQRVPPPDAPRGRERGGGVLDVAGQDKHPSRA